MNIVAKWVTILLMAASLVATGGCDRTEGTYRVVEFDRTLGTIRSLPPGYTDGSLADYKRLLTTRYRGRSIKLTHDEPPSFLVPVHFDGSVSGMFNGAWVRDEASGSIALHEWVSGSLYMPWGNATIEDNRMIVTLPLAYDISPVVLYLDRTD